MQISITKLSRALLTGALLCLGVQTKAETLTADFNNGLPEGWSMYGSLKNNSDRSLTGKSTDKGVFSDKQNEKTDYIITSEIEGTLTLWGRTYTTRKYGYITIYSVNADDSFGEQIARIETGNTSSGSIAFKQYSCTLPAAGRIAIDLNCACIDDVTYTTAEVADGPSLTVNGFKSGDTFDFGGVAVSGGTEATFTLLNRGNADLDISSINVTGGYTITEGGGLTCIPAKQLADIKVATPAADASGVLTIETNDTESPYTVNLTSIWKQPAPVMSVDTEAINFGRVEASATRELTIANSGDATLTATLAVDNALYTVEPAAVTVEPGENATVTVTFNYDADRYGVHASILTVTPNVGEPAAIALSAKVADPNAWTEHFDDDMLPAGWETTGTAWSVADGVAKAAYSYSQQNSTLITPTLEVVAGDEMTFMYRATANYVTITVKAAKDGGDFKDIEKISADKMTDFEPCTISGLEPGKYRFSFKADDYELDDFEGFRLDANAPKMEVSPAAAADFGKVYATSEAVTYTVANAGTGSMTVEISTDNDCFTVSPSTLTDIVNGEPQTFTVSFIYDIDNLGEQSANITVTPTYSADDAVTIAAHAISRDPDIWEEDFEGGVIPADWNAGNGWSVTTPTLSGNNGTRMAQIRQPSKSSITTPRLYATEGQELKFYIGIPYDDALAIEYSADEYNWMPIDSDVEGYTESGDITFTAPASGYYYLRFTGNYAMLDNFIGFKLAPVTLVVSASNIPVTGNQYAPYKASVTITETGDTAENVSVKLLVDGEVAAQSEPKEIAPEETATFTLTYTPTEATDNASVQFLIVHGDETIYTDAVKVSINEAPVIGDNGSSTFLYGTLPSLVLRYTAVNGWNTIVLPFTPTDALFNRIFGESFEVFELATVDTDGTIIFSEANTYVAGAPYVVYAPQAVNAGDIETLAAGDSDIILNDVEIEAQFAGKTEVKGITINGYYSPEVPEEIDNAVAFDTDKPSLHKAAVSDFDKGFRCYITLPASAGNVVPPVRLGNYTVSGIDGVTAGNADSDAIVYDLNGRRVFTTRPNVPYIVNGKKTILK